MFLEAEYFFGIFRIKKISWFLRRFNYFVWLSEVWIEHTDRECYEPHDAR